MLQTQPMVNAKKSLIPALGLGTWELTGDTCQRGVEEALHLGYRHLDTAQMYGNEEQVGAGMQKARVERENLFLTTKVWFENYTEERFQKSVEESLRKLKTDYLNLLLLHWPKFDGPMEPVLDRLMLMQEQGKTLNIGVSNFTAAQLDRAQQHTQGMLITNQVEYHPFLDQTTVLTKVWEHDMALTAYSPLARGEALDNKVVKEIAEARKAHPAQVVLAWLLSQRHVVAIPKASSKEHLQSNLRSLELHLNEDEIKRIDALRSRDGRKVDPSFGPDWD